MIMTNCRNDRETRMGYYFWRLELENKNSRDDLHINPLLRAEGSYDWTRRRRAITSLQARCACYSDEHFFYVREPRNLSRGLSLP